MSSKQSSELIEWLQNLESIIAEYKSSDNIARGVEYQITRYSASRSQKEAAPKSYEGFLKGVHLTFDALSKVPSALCRSCLNIKVQNLPEKRTFFESDHDQSFYPEDVCVLHESYAALKSSAQNGCPSCMILWHAFVYETRGEANLARLFNSGENISSSKVWLFYTPHPPGKNPPQLNICCGPAVLNEIKGIWESLVVIDVGLMADAEMYWHPISDDINIGKKIEPNPISPSAIEKLQRWIGTCTKEHIYEFCPETDVPVLPTRVIDVGSSNGNEEPKLLLSNGKHAHYFALSHSWGKTPTTRTLLENIESHLHVLPLKYLARNFQDAITVTRRLGQRYLWIDSLCIIQDSAKDWELESAKMGDVYRNAFLTISARSAEHSQEGFIQPRDPKQYLCTPINHCDDSNIDIRHTTNGPSKCEISIRWPVPRRGPEWLSSRGWVQQEHYLSPRLVHFTTEELIFECATRQFKESGYMRHGDGIIEVYVKRAFYGLRLQAGDDGHQSKITPPKKTKEGILDTTGEWQNIVHSFTKTYLTNATDKLPALSGMAAELQRATKDTYLAGAWRNSLLEDILWLVVDPHKVTRLDFWRAPSWSWAAIDGVVGFVEPDSVKSHLSPEIIDAGTSTSEHNPLGAVTAGFIQMKGFLKPLFIDAIPDDWDDNLRCINAPITWNKDDGGKNIQVHGIVSVRFDDTESYLEQNLWCLPVLTREDGAECVGLVLKSNDTLNEYFRIGRFKIKKESFEWFEVAEKNIFTLV